MEKESIIRKQARKALSGNWIPFISALMTVFTAIMAAYLIGVVLAFATGADDEAAPEWLTFICFLTMTVALMILSPLKNGFMRMCYKRTLGNRADYSEMFFYFRSKSSYARALHFNVMLFMRFAVYCVLCMLPNIICAIFIGQGILYSVLFGLGTAGLIVLSNGLIIREFTFADSDIASVEETNRLASKINRSHRLDLLALTYSFIPWLALCFFVLPVLYVMPYFFEAHAVSAKWLIKLHKEG